MNITLVISSLSSGGAERVMSNMANYWARSGWTVTLITFSGNDSDFYVLDKGVTRIALDVEKDSYSIINALINNIKRLSVLRSAVKSTKPDAVISFVDKTNIHALLALWFTSIPVIISERVDPRYYRIGRIWHYLRILLYPMASALVIQSSNLQCWAGNKILKKKIFVIPNPVINVTGKSDKIYNEFPKPFALAVGRLEVQKGFDLLLRSFAKISSRYPNWSLVVIGDGNERSRLENLSQELGVDSRVYFIGRHPDPVAIMGQASFFVLSSRFEGFPNVLLEAMACGLPSVSFDCPSGPSEIIRHGIDGILVPQQDVGALAEAMQGLMENPYKRNELSARALEVCDRFSMDNIMVKWNDLLLKIHEVHG